MRTKSAEVVLIGRTFFLPVGGTPLVRVWEPVMGRAVGLVRVLDLPAPFLGSLLKLLLEGLLCREE